MGIGSTIKATVISVGTNRADRSSDLIVSKDCYCVEQLSVVAVYQETPAPKALTKTAWPIT